MTTADAGHRPGAGWKTVGDLAVAALVLPADTPVLAVEQRLHDQPTARGVVVRHRGRWQLVTRTHLGDVLSGTYGYGRALASRQRLADLLPVPTVVVRAGASLPHAAELALQEIPVVTDLVVEDGGALGLVPVFAVFAGLAEAYRRAALVDPLTGLANRLALQDAATTRGGPHPTTWSALYVDLDRFKEVNDTFGHRVGDSVLKDFAARLEACTRPGDVVARVGGDEFVVLLADVDEDQACAIADRVVRSAAEPYLVGGEVVAIGASVGVAVAAEGALASPAGHPEGVLLSADTALYEAKAAGRGRWARLDGRGRTVGPPLARRLRLALEADRLTLHYQPKTVLKTGRVVEVEALCRWSEPDLGAVPPSTFIPLAEQTGLIVPLGAWVLEQACQQARRWADAGHDLGVAVNISAVQLARPGFADEVADVLARTGLAAGRLRLEITESAAIGDLAPTVTRLRRLAALGVLLSLDDFGTGYSSLSLLRSLPVHGLKIDKSFVDRVDLDEDDAALVSMVIQLAHQLRLTVIAEGVERPEQLAVLRALGCDAVQGFLLGHPVPADELVLPAPA